MEKGDCKLEESKYQISAKEVMHSKCFATCNFIITVLQMKSLSSATSKSMH